MSEVVQKAKFIGKVLNIGPQEVIVSNLQMLVCARRELAMRRSVYPKWMQAGRMNAEKAETEIDAMTAIVAMLERIVGDAEVQSDS